MILALVVLGFGLWQVIIQRHATSREKLIFGSVLIGLSAIPLVFQSGILFVELVRGRRHFFGLLIHRSLMNILGEHGPSVNLVAKHYRHREVGDYGTGLFWTSVAYIGHLFAKVFGMVAFGDAFSGMYNTRKVSTMLWLDDSTIVWGLQINCEQVKRLLHETREEKRETEKSKNAGMMRMLMERAYGMGWITWTTVLLLVLLLGFYPTVTMTLFEKKKINPHGNAVKFIVGIFVLFLIYGLLVGVGVACVTCGDRRTRLKEVEMEIVREMRETEMVREMGETTKMGVGMVKEVLGETELKWEAELVKGMVRAKVGELEMGMMGEMMNEIGFVKQMERDEIGVVRKIVRIMESEMEMVMIRNMKLELGMKIGNGWEWWGMVGIKKFETDRDRNRRKRKERVWEKREKEREERENKRREKERERKEREEEKERRKKERGKREKEKDMEIGNQEDLADANEEAEYLIISEGRRFFVWVLSHLYSFVVAQLNKNLLEPVIDVDTLSKNRDKPKIIRQVKLTAHFSPLPEVTASSSAAPELTASSSTPLEVPVSSSTPSEVTASSSMTPERSIPASSSTLLEQIPGSSSMPLEEKAASSSIPSEIVPERTASTSTPSEIMPETTASSSTSSEITPEMTASSSTEANSEPNSSTPETSTPMFRYSIFATGSKDTFISSLYGEAFFGQCTRDAALEFCKLRKILDDDTFIVAGKPWETTGNIFACEKLETIVKSIWMKGKKSMQQRS